MKPGDVSRISPDDHKPQHRVIHMDLVWKKIYEDVRRNRVLVFNRESAAALKGLCVAPLSTVVTHKVRNVHDFSFDVDAARGEK